jgi:aspartate racemase
MAGERLPGLEIVNMLETCVLHVKLNMPDVRRIGYLASQGTYASGVYYEYFRADDGFALMEPDERGRERVHEAIYSKEFGIKAHSSPVNAKARNILLYEAFKLEDRGAEAVILGCTEIPLAVNAGDFLSPVIDPGRLAARRLISLAAPEKLLTS